MKFLSKLSFFAFVSIFKRIFNSPSLQDVGAVSVFNIGLNEPW
jgi:hypothetical protein